MSLRLSFSLLVRRKAYSPSLACWLTNQDHVLAERGAADGRIDRRHLAAVNCILPLTDPEWEKTHAESVLGAAERYGFDKGRFFDCRKDRDAAVASIAKAIDDSTAADPLYFIIAGPMEVPYLGIQKSDPAKLD